MKNLNTLNHLREWALERRCYGGNGDNKAGMFSFNELRIIATSGSGWEHVSVSLGTRCPTWDEMELVKRMFFEDHETAMQLHVPPAEHVNCHPFCLHLWRPLGIDIPRPPSILVGPS